MYRVLHSDILKLLLYLRGEQSRAEIVYRIVVVEEAGILDPTPLLSPVLPPILADIEVLCFMAQPGQGSISPLIHCTSITICKYCGYLYIALRFWAWKNIKSWMI